MMFKTHIIASVLVGLLFVNLFFPDKGFTTSLMLFLLVVLGGLIPDIDHPKSKVGRKVKPIGFLFEHRGFFHSFLALGLFSFLLLHFTNDWNYFSAFFLGYLTHLILDSLNFKGIMPFHPISRVRLTGFIRTGSIGEYAFLLALLSINIFLFAF